MEARRVFCALLATACAAVSGCAMLQPRSSPTVDKTGDAKRKDPPEVVAHPASRPAKAQEEESNAIVQWAKGAMKAREAPPAHATHAPPAGEQPDPSLAADSPPGDLYEATIPVRTDGAPAATPAAASQGPAPAARREVAVRREQPESRGEAESGAAAAKTAPPVLGAISVRPGSREPSKTAAKPSEAPRVALNSPESAAASGENLKDLLDDALAQPGDSTFREQLDRKMLLVMKGETEKAREPFVLASQSQQEMGKRLLEALIAIREGHGGDPSGEAADVLAQVNQLRESLLKVSDLTLPTFAICRAVRGFGQYDAIDPPRFPAGRDNEFVAYCEIKDFVSEQRDGAFVSNFGMRIAILDRTDDEVHAVNAEDILDRCRTRRSDCFLSPLVRLPASLAAGEYVARITIHDKIGKKVAEKLAKFRLVAKS